MVRTFAVLAFIGIVGTGALYLSQRPTIARGDVIAADLVGQNTYRGWRHMTCDPDIPIGVSGAQFRCGLEMSDGDRAEVEITLDRAGSYQMKILSETAAKHRHVPVGADPWGD